MSEEIGFVGLGNMGLPMARRLLGAGHRLVVSDMRPEARQALAEAGARAVETAREVADGAETVFVSLPTPPVVEMVICEEGGIINGGAVKRVVDLSTTGATTAARIAERLKARGIAHLDSPVSGGKAGAAKGTLAVMVSGPKDHYSVVGPLLQSIGKQFFVGEKAGLGQTMKLANNLLSATALAATSEAMVMAVKAGIDPSVAIEVINVGSGRNSASEDKFPKAIIPRSFDFGFTTGLMHKDLRLCMEEAEALGVQMLVSSAVKQLWQITQAEFGAESDFTRIVQIPEKWAGIQVGEKKA